MLKSSGSAFENFVRDEFTTLVEVNDRIFSTAVDMQYTFSPIALGQHTSLLETLAATMTMVWEPYKRVDGPMEFLTSSN